MVNAEINIDTESNNVVLKYLTVNSGRHIDQDTIQKMKQRVTYILTAMATYSIDRYFNGIYGFVCVDDTGNVQLCYKDDRREPDVIF
jgi:hypothetical protein